jgi:hypothetical protein
MATTTVGWAPLLLAVACHASPPTAGPSARPNETQAPLRPPSRAETPIGQPPHSWGEPVGAVASSDWTLDFDGELGGSGPGPFGAIGVTMHLTRTGARVSGVYMYIAYATPIGLEGSIDASGEMTLSERLGPRDTGRFRLSGDPHCMLTGAWTDPSGKRTLPARFTPLCMPLVAPSPAELLSGSERAVAPGSRGALLDFYVKLSKFNGAPANRAFFDRTLTDTSFSADASAAEELAGHGIHLQPGPVYAENASVYLADVNNDGMMDYVYVTETHCTGCGPAIEATYDAIGEDLVPVVLDLDRRRRCEHREICFPGQLDSPAFVIGRSGTEIHFKEDRYVDGASTYTNELSACGSVRDAYRLVMHGHDMRLLEHSRKVNGCSGAPARN